MTVFERMHMPAFAGATEWLKSEPLGPAELQGRVVLVNFWTLTCVNWLVSRNPRDAECGDNLLNGDEMKTETQSQDRDREATTGRFPLALFVVAELLCTGALIASVILWG
jgi:hypothetical protein